MAGSQFSNLARSWVPRAPWQTSAATLGLLATLHSVWAGMPWEGVAKLLYSAVMVSNFGFIWERIILGKLTARDGLLDRLFNIPSTSAPLPFLTIYGASYVLLTFTHPWLQSWAYPSLAASIMSSTAECALGEMSFLWHGTASWQYPAAWIPMCNGFVSVVATAVWGGVYWAYNWVVIEWNMLHNPHA